MCTANFRTNPITKSYELLLSQVHQQLDKNNLLNKYVGSKGGIPRSCHEVRLADPSLPTDVYWIDPDGQDVEDDPIITWNATCLQVNNDYQRLIRFFQQLIVDIFVVLFVTETTFKWHNTEGATNVNHCTEPGCSVNRLRGIFKTNCGSIWNICRLSAVNQGSYFNYLSIIYLIIIIVWMLFGQLINNWWLILSKNHDLMRLLPLNFSYCCPRVFSQNVYAVKRIGSTWYRPSRNFISINVRRLNDYKSSVLSCSFSCFFFF